MTLRGRLFLLFCISLWFGGLPGCRQAEMYLDPSVRSAMDLFPVRDRQGLKMLDESFSFPPYAVTEVDRGWKVTTRWGILGLGKVASEQDYSFVLRRKDAVVGEVQCGTAARWKEFSADNLLGTGTSLTWILSDDTRLACVLKVRGQDKACSLGMQPTGPKGSMTGTLLCGADQVTITPTFRLAGSPISYTEPTGYLFSRQDGLVAAVEVLNQGRVWLAHDLSSVSRDTLASTASVIFLYNRLQQL